MKSNLRTVLFLAAASAMVQAAVTAANEIQEIKLTKTREPKLYTNRRYAGKQKAQWKSEVTRSRKTK